MSIYQFTLPKLAARGVYSPSNINKGGAYAQAPYGLSNYLPPGWNSESGTPEIHAPYASYEGPGTNIRMRWVNKRLHGTTATDEAARKHDIQYNNLGIQKARGKISQAQLEKGIQNSDNRLLKAANQNMISLNPLNAFHAQLANAGIRAKRGLQNWNLLSKTAFTGNLASKPLINEDIPQTLSDLPSDYLQGGKKRKFDRLKKLRKALKKMKF